MGFRRGLGCRVEGFTGLGVQGFRVQGFKAANWDLGLP